MIHGIRRLLAIFAAFMFVGTACSSDELTVQGPATTVTATTEETSSPSTVPGEETTTSTTTTSTPPSAVWSVVQVDEGLPNGGFWRKLDVVVLPDGRSRVIYGSGTSLRMGTCVDVACSDTEVVEVLDTAPALAGELWMSAAVRGDGSPVIVTADYNPEPTAELRLVWCEDPECASVTTSVLPDRRYNEPWLVSSPDGRVGVFDVVSTEPSPGQVDSFVAFTYCDGPECLDDPDGLTELRFVSVDEFLLVGRAVGGFDSDGPPVALHNAIPSSGITEVNVVACEDVDCLSVGEPQTIDSGTAPGPESMLRSPAAGLEGRLLLLYEALSEAGGDITVAACEGVECSVVESSVVLDSPPGAQVPFDGALGADGLLRLVWATPDGFVLTTCGDEACAEFVTSGVIPYRAPQIGMATTSDGAVVVATGEFREPSEPNIAPGVWLLRCEDRPCTPPEPPS